jgi:hypothetical protein
VPRIPLLGSGPSLCQCMASMDGRVVTYRTLIRGCSGEDERAGLYGWRAHGLRRCRDGWSLGPQGYVELPLSESGRMPESRVMSTRAPGIEAMRGLSQLTAAGCPRERGGDSRLYLIGHVHTACWRGVPL